MSVVGLDELIASKEWANRPKDHEALPELRALHGDAPNEEGVVMAPGRRKLPTAY